MQELLKAFLERMAFESGTRILAIDEARALYAGDAVGLAAVAAAAPTSVGVVPLVGSLYPRALNDFASRIDAAAANADVGHIVIPVDSPGGTVAGTPEAAAAVARAAAIKPVTAHVGGLGASAAYWAISPSTHVHASPSAELGSIGVMGIHTDLSKMMSDAGIAHTVLRSTPFKGEGNPFEPLGEEARAHLQGQIDEAHDQFVRAVAAGRGVSMAKVNADFGQGRTMGAAKAVDAGMADRVASLADTIAGARRKMTPPRRRSAALL